MSIAPIVQTVTVKPPPPRAFELFVTRMQDWWTKGRTIGKSPHVAIVAEPRAGGRWYETDAQGVETDWGRVLAWEPPRRLLFAWQINSRFTYDPQVTTEVELTFTPAEGGGTVVRLEHRNLEGLGVDAAATSDLLRNGWPGVLGGYAEFVDAQP